MKLAMLAPYTVTEKMTGGVERHIKNLIASLSKFSDLEIHVVSSPKRVNRTKVHRKRNVIFHQLKSNRLPRTITGITSDAYKIVKEVKKIRPDIVHGQMSGAPYGLATMLVSKRYPTVLTVHTLMSQKRKATYSLAGKMHNRISSHLGSQEIKKIPHLIIVSMHLKRELEQWGARNIYVIPNGVEKRWFKTPSKEKDGRILFVGRIDPIKRIEHLLRATKIIKNVGKKIETHIIGPIDDRHYYNTLLEDVKRLRIDEDVFFSGRVYSDIELEKEYAECSIFVLCSQDESSPIALLEAMAAGKPVVATNVGGVPQLINDGKNGFLVKYGGVNELSEKIMQLLTNEKLRSDMGKSGREYAKEFDWKKIAKETYDLYQEIIEHYSKMEKDVL